MKNQLIIYIIVLISLSCSFNNKREKEEEISSKLNLFFDNSPFNVKFKTKIQSDSLFIELENLDSDTSYRDYRQEHFLYNLCFYEFFNSFKNYEYVSFSLPYKHWDYVSNLWYTQEDIVSANALFKRNLKLIQLASYIKDEVSPYESRGIQKSLDSLQIGFSDVDFEGDFYELLVQYAFDCEKDIKESKYKKYMFVMTVLCKRGGQPFKEEYEALKDILNECDIDTNVLHKKGVY